MILEQILKQTESIMRKEVKNLLNGSIISINILDEAYELADKRFKRILPPNELNNRAANPIAIINSGWYAKLLYNDTIVNKIGSIDKSYMDFELNNLINDLLKYALKTSRIQRRWHE